MTQLVAAICHCEGNPKVIGMTDRMLSSSDMTLTFERDEAKIEIITNKTVVLTAGTIDEPDLIRDARGKARGKEQVKEVAELLKEAYKILRVKHIEDEILYPLGGLASFKEYQEKQKTLHDALILDLNDKIRKYNVGLSLLLIGIDEQGGHIIHVSNPGIWRSLDNLGFLCLGMGDRHADNVFAWYKYTTSVPFTDALYISFEAKKKAEAAGGVGQATDIVIIDKEGIYIVDQNTVADLEDIYSERETTRERRGFDKRILELKVAKRKMETP